MRTRLPAVVVALGVAGLLFAPDVADADVTHDRVATTFGGGGAHMLVVRTSRTAIAVTAAPCSRVRGRALKQDPEETVTLDQTDPWTGEQVPAERVAGLTRKPLELVDPWNGQPITLPGVALAQLDGLDPYTRD